MNMSLITFFTGTESDNFIKKHKKNLVSIHSHIEVVSLLSDSELKEKTGEFKKRISDGESLDSLLPEVFAVVSEVSKRTTGLTPFDVQFFGGIALHNGSISEMRTGEGKTLVAVMPAYLNALVGDSVHIVTVNDYLARRDAVWMGQIYSFLGMSVGVINGENASYLYDAGHTDKDKQRDEEGGYKIVYDFLSEIERKSAYECDIVYGTNNEFAFDYLRDNIAYSLEEVRQKKFHFAIVDEVDSILIDEARSPLIISSPSNIPASQYKQFADFANQLVLDEDYEIDEKSKSILLLPEGISKLEKVAKMENVFVEGGQGTIHRVQNALKAKSLFTKDKQYIVQNGNVVIVDEFTGRLQPGRQWSEGLHQAIEAKENVEIHQENRTYASITFQNFFRLYGRLAGMTGTAKSSEEEFYKVYAMPVISIPTNHSVKRIDHQDIIYQTKKAKLNAIVERIKELNKKGQPVLVGTASIDHNEELSNLLKKSKVPHEVLNAKNHEREGEIISAAGSRGSVTIATNLAGRGVDIKLGGAKNQDVKEHADEVRGLGGLFVLGTERHESRRIDDQLRGRCGRQGDEGETQFYLSLEDDLTRVFGSDRVLGIAQKLGLPEEQAIQNKIISNSIESAQKRIEGHHFDARRFSLQYDTVLNKHRQEVYRRRREVLFAKDDSIFTNYINNEDLQKIKDADEGKYFNISKTLILRSIDIVWVDHLSLMDHARSSTSLRSYGQKEPLMEYRKEGRLLFSNFWILVNEKTSQEVQKMLSSNTDTQGE